MAQLDLETALLPLVYFATVTDTKDPLDLGRVQVKLRGFLADVVMTDVWLRMVQLYASKEFGVTFLPEVGDEVVVLRTVGDTVEAMLIIGAVHNGAAKPKNPDKDGKNNTKEIRTRTGNAITFSDEAGKEGITLTTAEAKITISLANADKGLITIDGADKIVVKAATEISFESKDVKIKASANLELGGATEVKMDGGKLTMGGTDVKVTASGAVAIAGTTIDLG
jgi:uncharacterized protein involved in type VI secretion and phage assembly